MNLAYLEFIGAIEIDRSPVAITPSISFDKPIGKESRVQYTYLDTKKRPTIEQLEAQLKRAKKEEENAIKYVYNQIIDIAKETDSSLSTDYIRHELEECKLPRYIVRGGVLGDNGKFAKGDVIFLEEEVYIFTRWFTLEFLEELKKKFKPKRIRIMKGTLSRDPMEIILDMSNYS